MPQLAIALLGACAAAFAAAVPQKSIGDYYFSRPICTNVTGTVIGEPPAYSTLRREDIAWLREAFAERRALLTRKWRGARRSIDLTPTAIGRYPLSSSNAFRRITTAKEWKNGVLETNIVVGYNYVTNFGTGIDRLRDTHLGITDDLSYEQYQDFDSYLSTDDADWLQSSQTVVCEGKDYYVAFADRWGLSTPHTNIITNVTTSYPSYYYDDNNEYVDNTTQHVEIITMPMTNGTVSAWTNSWRVPLPRVEAQATTNVLSGDYHDMLFTGREPKTYDIAEPEAFAGIPRYSTVTNWYGWLRGMRRLANEVDATNEIKSYRGQWAGGKFHNGYPSEYHDGDYIEISGGRDEGSGAWGHGTWPASGVHTMDFDSGFTWQLVTTGGVNRIEAATLYVVIGEVYGYRDGAKYGSFAKKIGRAAQAETPSTGGNVVFSAPLDVMSLYREAASAMGLGYFPSMDGSDDCEYFHSFIKYYLVFDIAPWASLPDW